MTNQNPNMYFLLLLQQEKTQSQAIQIMEKLLILQHLEVLIVQVSLQLMQEDQ